MHIRRFLSIVLVLLVIISMSGCKSSAEDYNKAVSAFEAGDTDTALSLFKECGKYKASKEFVFYITARNRMRNNNEVVYAAENLVRTMKNVNINASVENKTLDYVQVSSRNSSNNTLSLIIYASCVVRSSSGDVSCGDVCEYTLNCSDYDLDLETCAKIIQMTPNELISYSNSK